MVPGGNVIGMVSVTLPVFKLTLNDSPRPSTVPGPLGMEITLGRVPDLSGVDSAPMDSAKGTTILEQ